MKSIAIVVTAMLLFSSCSWFGEPEQYKTETGRTTYRSADQTASDTVTAAPQKIPGESKKASSDRQ